MRPTPWISNRVVVPKCSKKIDINRPHRGMVDMRCEAFKQSRRSHQASTKSIEELIYLVFGAVKFQSLTSRRRSFSWNCQKHQYIYSDNNALWASQNSQTPHNNRKCSAENIVINIVGQPLANKHDGRHTDIRNVRSGAWWGVVAVARTPRSKMFVSYTFWKWFKIEENNNTLMGNVIWRYEDMNMKMRETCSKSISNILRIRFITLILTINILIFLLQFVKYSSMLIHILIKIQ